MGGSDGFGDWTSGYSCVDAKTLSMRGDDHMHGDKRLTLPL